MIDLHIYIEPFVGKERELEELYRNEYISAISTQKGFQRSILIKKRDALRKYEIDIAFDSEELRLKWVNSKEHQKLWPRIENLCLRASWVGFDVVGKPAKLWPKL